MDLREENEALKQRLRESEARERLLTESWVQAVWETEPNGGVVADSSSWRADTGLTIEQSLGYDWLDAIHPDDRSNAERQWRDAVATRGLVDAEFRIRAPDGGWRWTNVRAALVTGADGEIRKWVGLNIDVDARRRAEDAVRESEVRYRTLFDNMAEGLTVVETIRDGDGRVVDQLYLDLNAAMEEQLGVGREAFAGRLLSEIAAASDFEAWMPIHRQVADTGEPWRGSRYSETTDRWYEMSVYRTGKNRLSVFSRDVSEEKRALAILNADADRQAFLLRLSDALRAERDADAVAMLALTMLRERLGLDRCYIATYRPDEDAADFPYQIGNGKVPPLPTSVRLSDFPEAYEQVLDHTFVVEDDHERRGLTAEERVNSEALGMRAMLASTVRRGEGNPLSSMMAVMSTPRRWTANEIALVEEVAERTWAAMARARGEAALRASEERFREFAAASAAGLWIRDAGTLEMEFTSPAIAAIYGVGADALLGGVERWAATIVPDDRDTALGHLERARGGETAVHEFRIQRASDGLFRWIRNTDFPLRDDGQVSRIGGIAEDVTEAKLAVEHQGVLLAELQHRVRNMMAMIRAMVRLSAESAADVDEYRTLLEGRLLALARVQALLTRQANTGGSLRAIIESEVDAQGHAGQYRLDGPDVQLSPRVVEVLTLALHELATNALKYGAFSVPEGRLHVAWAPFEKNGRRWLAIDWIEAGTPPRGPVTRRGFGSDLIEGKIPYELGGTGKISIEPAGARCRLEFPLKEGGSILETDAPTPTRVIGGTLDMTGAPDLTGRSVLVVEDDYYIAGDTAAALRGAGATVLGPCPNEEAGLDLLETATPSHAVLDLNLGGGGPQFTIAHTLKARGVPFIFLTGYDPDAVPPDLANIVRLQKPVPFRKIVEAVGQLE